MIVDKIRRHKILASISIIFLAIVLILVIIIIFSEPIVKSLLEKKGGSTLERELFIEGDFQIHWHWTYTSVHAEKIRLGNAPDYPEPNMLTIESLDLTFKPLQLLRGRLEFGDISLDRPILILDKKSATDFNWNFPALSKANAADEAAIPDNRHEFPIIQSLQLKSGNLIYRDAIKGMNLNVKLDSVVGQGTDKNKDEQSKELKISGTGSMQNQKFTLEAQGGSLKYLRDSNKDYPLSLNLVMGQTKVSLNGVFKDPIKLRGVNASLKVTGNNLADIFYLTAIPLPPTPPYKLAGQLTKEGGVWGYKDFKGEVGKSDLSGNLSYDTSKERGFLKANLISNLLDSEDLGGFIGLPPSGENASPEQKKAAAEKKASAKLIPDVPLKLERLRATDLDVTLKAVKIEAPNLPFKGMEVRFDLRNGLLKLDPLNVVLADGTIDGDIEVDANKDVPPMKLNLNLRKLSLGQFFVNTRFAKTSEGLFGGKVNLAGAGASLADVLATSNGELVLIMSGGKISQLLIEASDLDIAQAVPLFLGKDKATKIRCGVTDFAVEDGILKSKVVVLDTNDSVLVGNVSINLKRETINAKLDAKPKDSSIFAVQTPIVLSGQLKSPNIGLDGKKVGNRATTAIVLGSLLTPFAAVLPFIERSDAENVDCRALLKAAESSSKASATETEKKVNSENGKK
ncbi:MAG: AsmA family protein [Gammaproteobacteria bacterium]|nr:MAG: AsmA family protein [Gammaproteobacteria bacterium]